MIKPIVCLAVLVASLACATARSDWINMGPAPLDAVVKFTFAVRQNPAGVKKIDGLFWDLSNPRSVNFGQWLTRAQVKEIVKPSDTDKAAVINFCRRNRIAFEDFGEFVEAHATVGDLGDVFRGRFEAFQNARNGVVLVRNPNARLPSEISGHVDFISDLVELPPSRDENDRLARRRKPFSVPQTFHEMYGVPSPGNTNKDNIQAVVEFGEVTGFSISDLFTFERNTNLPQQNLSTIVGPFETDPSSISAKESSLDAQLIIGTAPGTNTEFWAVQGWMFNLPLLVAKRQEEGFSVPFVYSLSFDMAEVQQCRVTLGYKYGSCWQLGVNNEGYIHRTDSEFAKMGVQGMTLVVASGDNGAAGKNNPNCDSTTYPPFNPLFPASSPYVVSVGGTVVWNSTRLPSPGAPPICKGILCIGSGEEAACSIPFCEITSGGGFSNFQAMPSFQQSFVSDWESKTEAGIPAGYYNASGRAYPDVSAVANSCYFEFNGFVTRGDGTSASAPTFAGIVSQFNAVRMNMGKSAIGPLIQIIYQMPTNCFHDITVGNNKGTEHAICDFGYDCTVGWDPVTGRGTPNFPNMVNYVKSLR